MLTKLSMHQYNNIRYIDKPNLPQGKVTLAAISEQAGESAKKLNSLGIETISIKPDSKFPTPVNSHADIQLLHFNKNNLFVYNEHLFSGDWVTNFHIKKISETPGNKYPHDVRLNCTIIGNHIICNTKTLSKDILKAAESAGLTVINVNQGYSGCSVCVVDENSIITDDESIFAAAGNFLNDALLISKGSIGLNGYNYGFIGGCCGKIDKNKIAFNGTIESHKDCYKITDFLTKRNIECVELSSEPLYDIGGIIPLCEVDIL